MSPSNQIVPAPRRRLLGGNYQTEVLESTYRPPFLSGGGMITQSPTQRAYRHYTTSQPEYIFSRRKMEEHHRPMTEEELRDEDLEIKRQRVEVLGYMFASIPVDAAHGERIAMRKERTGLADPIGRYRPQRQAATQSPNASNSFGPPPEPVSPQQSAADSGAFIQVTQLCAAYHVQY